MDRYSIMFVAWANMRITICFILTGSLASAVFTSHGIAALPVSEFGKPTAVKMADSVQMLARYTKANYERIDTWEGIFDVEDTHLLSPDKMAEFAKLSGKTIVVNSSVIKSVSSQVTFKLDQDSGSLYSDVKQLGTVFRDSSSGAEIEFTTKPFWQKTILLADGCNTFEPEVLYGQFRISPDTTPARGRAAFRDDPKTAYELRMSTIIDPRRCFYETNLPIWEFLGMWEKMLRVGMSSEAERKAAESEAMEVDVVEERSSGNTEFVVTIAMGPGLRRRFRSFTFSEGVGYNLTDINYEDSAGRAGLSTEIEYTDDESEGVYVPIRWCFSNPSDIERVPRFQRNLHLKNYSINKPVGESSFDVTRGFELEDGDRFVDRIENTVHVLTDGKLKLAPTRGAALAQESNSLLQRVFLIANVLVVIVITVFVISKRYRKTHSSASD